MTNKEAIEELKRVKEFGVSCGKDSVWKYHEALNKAIEVLDKDSEFSAGYNACISDFGLEAGDTDKLHEWEHRMAYFTDEDVATPEGVSKWVMDKLEEKKEATEEHNQDLIAHEKDIDNNYVHKSKLNPHQSTVDEIEEVIKHHSAVQLFLLQHDEIDRVFEDIKSLAIDIYKLTRSE